jgi:hypothetical protein
MAKRMLAGFLVAVGLVACSAGEEASPVDEPSPSADAVPPADEVTPEERDVAPVARYRFVDTSDGMTVEAATDTQVTTFSCPTRTCAGLCDECAARACLSAGELSGACQFLVTSCNDTCTCESPNGNCGLPVCASDSKICYVADEASLSRGPSDPTDPSPFGPAGRPSESSSNAARPNL